MGELVDEVHECPARLVATLQLVALQLLEEPRLLLRRIGEQFGAGLLLGPIGAGELDQPPLALDDLALDLALEAAGHTDLLAYRHQARAPRTGLGQRRLADDLGTEIELATVQALMVDISYESEPAGRVGMIEDDCMVLARSRA